MVLPEGGLFLLSTECTAQVAAACDGDGALCQVPLVTRRRVAVRFLLWF